MNAWSNLTFSGRPAARIGHTTAWCGSEMIVWGGLNEFLRDIGGRYQATNDVWTPTPPTGERSERRGHTALWTGNELIVWGGFDGERYLNTGGRYLPASNTWLPVPTNGTPTGRVTHSMVWTGTEMIVGGGGGPNFLETGGRYNPARAEMVVHGGYNSDSLSGITAFLDDTWHYAPPRTMFLYLKP